MSSRFTLSLLLCLAIAAHAQDDPLPTLNIGDPAPPMRVQWLKGTPVERFEKGKVYVLEFWATWCGPCKAAMPHLSALAREYKDKAVFIGVDVYENKNTPLARVRTVVDSIGDRMAYDVAAEDSNFMEKNWMFAAGEQHGIPKTFVIDAEGRLAWIGHPSNLAGVLSKMVNNTWDIKAYAVTRSTNRYLEALDDSLNYELAPYRDKPVAALVAIDKIVKDHPALKYAPLIFGNTFRALLATNPDSAYTYAKVAMATPSYEEFPYHVLVGLVQLCPDSTHLPAKIYLLAADACQAEIDGAIYPEISDIPSYYYKMGDCYWHAHDKAKAIEAEQKGMEVLKSKKSHSSMKQAAFEARLQEYNR